MIAVTALLCALHLGALPALQTSGDLEPQGLVREEALQAWTRDTALFEGATHTSPRPFPGSIRIQKGPLPRGHAGSSRLGQVFLRQAQPFVLSPAERIALRHELAHQFLLGACPQAAADFLFHEAFALSVSGELSSWEEGGYSGLSAGVQTLSEGGPGAVALDSRPGRRALARLLVETLPPGGELPAALDAPLKRCADGVAWKPLTAQALLTADAGVSLADPSMDAWIVVHRASGEVVAQQGDVRRKIPYGSTLKPFVVAGAAEPPPELPRGSTPEWLCGEGLPATLTASRALVRSCNGYFLDWGSRDPHVAKLGAWGTVLRGVGLERLPASMAEAIGLQATLSLSPLGLAQAYRVLALARPDLLEVLREVPRDGTLSGLPVSRALSGWALKTGTVRDARSRPRFGWIVGVSDGFVVVMVKSGQMPRSFAAELSARLQTLPADGSAQVQVLGLLEPATVTASCAGGAVAVQDRTPRALPVGPFALEHEAGTLLCLNGPFLVRFPGVTPAEGRPYAGTFTWSPQPALVPSPDRSLSLRAQRARRGSDFIFQTSRSLYATGVVASEDDAAQGEARLALLKVTDANGQRSRHGSRPVCDTTHCQVFQGTVGRRPGDAAALAHPLSTTDWLPFSKGGRAPWREERSQEQVEAVVGRRFTALTFKPGEAWIERTRLEGEGVVDDSERVGCEVLRGPLKLPSCPKQARKENERWVFEGEGTGHGLGLDMEKAKASGLSAEEMLLQAYGKGMAPPAP